MARRKDNYPDGGDSNRSTSELTAKEKISDYDRYRGQEYTEADATAVNFMHEVAEVVGPAPVYVTEYYVLWKTAGTNLPRWLGPYDQEETANAQAAAQGAIVLSRVVEKELTDQERGAFDMAPGQ